MTTITDYRSDLDSILATAVDASTWTDAIFDEGLRLALGELNSQLVYEDDFEVQTTGYEQDLSGITDLFNISGLAYPWVEGSAFGECAVGWRWVGHNLVYFVDVEPQDGEIIRVRYGKLHKIQSLDSAASTTVAEAHRRLVGLWAAAYCCDLRVRQISEDPALPRAAAGDLRQVAADFREMAKECISHIAPSKAINWYNLGL